MANHLITKIVSGGQTGVDRAALDVAIYLDIEHGGWCPAGRRSEAGEIPAVYQLRETQERDYNVRTEKNILESDGTLILFRHKLTGGTALTWRLAEKHRRPLLRFDLMDDESSKLSQYAEFVRWIQEKNVCVLNVAGPRESSHDGIGKMAESFLINALVDCQH